MKIILRLFFLLLIVSQFVVAQVLPSDTVAAKIKFQQKDNSVNFESELRPLRQIAGAPSPFYTYLWEFGDGGFSFDEKPLHTYTDSGTYHPRVYATNNYDDGVPPPMKPGTIKIKSNNAPTKLAAQPNFFKPDESIALKTNCMPKPNEEMVLLMGYKNNPINGSLANNGTLILFYNDQEFKNDNFKIDEVRTHFKEQKSDLKRILMLSALSKHQHHYYAAGPNANAAVLKENTTQLINKKLAAFKNAEVWEYHDLQKNQERFMFLSIKTTSEMIKDTNAVVSLSAMMIPDDPLADINTYDLELQIVASHDPNKMVLKNRTMNYRFVGKNRELTYKVKFQNTGKGPAKLVNIGVNIPSVFDKSSIKIIDAQPKIDFCTNAYSGQSCLDTVMSKDSVNFIFRNIYLPGVQQDGVNDKDSTKGFIEYKLKFAKKPKKIPFNSGAAIVFDKNEAIYTNTSKGKFNPGISPGIMLGYGYLGGSSTLNELGNKNVSLGFSLSPYSPYRKYLQAEIYINSYNTTIQLVSSQSGLKQDTAVNNRDGYIITNRDYYKQSKKLDIDLVPIQLRYNINSFVGVGAGAIASFTITEKSKNIQKILAQQANGNASVNLENVSAAIKKNFADINSAVFADLQLGLVRKGPALGIRYIKSLSLKNQRFFTYLSWKI